MAFELPPLPYDYSALQPYMSAQTLQFHHDKHHQAYVTKLNELVAGSELEGKSLEEVVKASFGKAEKQGVFNNAGQHWNHILFWEWMAPQGSRAIPSELEKRLVADFGSVDNFKKEFTAGGVAQFGSGWVWLVEDGGKLSIMKTPNAENPLAHGKHALLGCDVWEHSYYLDYQNRRPDYLNAFLDQLVNWETVAVRLQEK
ncbi:superoxide dismutase [Azospirillum sp. RWY-5-1]|uniref:Superoxide dismutase n=1 Tax=Azospirillum oleiclasticum TaxID=2735135 RepID=A0ABX2TFE8_9PROT|nr:superoxide dismutase [Azospirillum oleiclasticum]NYZ14269.1 superoxide dismutase [Azospirillum oleiclasticum]NYZ21754.1 superoxide dismutase [Azospirillum oleiclasticum]